MGMTLAEKIIARAAGVIKVSPDEIHWVDVDLAMIHDSGGPRRIWPMLDELGVRVWDPDRVILVADHYVPAQDANAAKILQTTRAFATEFGISTFYEAEGIAHTLVVEKGHLAELQTFFKAIREFITSYRYKNATWENIRDSFIHASQKKLGPFFDN